MKSIEAPWRIWVEAARPRTLPAAVAPVVAGSALALHDGGFVLPAAAACLGFALCVQIGTNFANDYYDHIKGADTSERVGPRRAVAAGLVAPATMRRAAGLAFGLAFLIGLTLLPFGGWPLLLIGVLSILCGYAYTGGPYPLAYHGLGDAFVFVFFGLVAVGATYYVQAGTLTLESWWLGAAVGALATNILVVNNYRDIATDEKAGKRTLAVRLGPGFARKQFLLGHLLAVGVTILLLARGVVAPLPGILLVVITIVLTGVQMRQLSRARTPRELIALLGATGRYLALFSLLVALALLW